MTCMHVFQTAQREHSGQVSELLTHLRTEGHYEGFVCSLIEADQESVVTDILQEDANKYKREYDLKGW